MEAVRSQSRISSRLPSIVAYETIPAKRRMGGGNAACVFGVVGLYWSGQEMYVQSTLVKPRTMITEPPAPALHKRTGHQASTLEPHLQRILLVMLATWLLAGCTGQPGPTPDCVATGVAVEKAVRATLTAEAPRPASAQAPSATRTPDAVATGVALQRAIAATLTAEQKDLPTSTETTALMTPTPDVAATGVAAQKAIAATLTAGVPGATTTSVPSASVASPAASFTAKPEQPTPTPSPDKPGCIWWHQAQAYVGSHQCICGVVADTYDDPNSAAFFINFDFDRRGYYAVSFNLTFTSIEGHCVEICGLVELYRGRPQTIISELNQLEELDTCP